MALIAWSDLTALPLADAVKAITDSTQQGIICADATVAVESYCRRRFDTFTITENHRAQAVDPDAQSDAWIPLDIPSSIGLSRAQSLGSTDLVRAIWLDEYPPRYQDKWSSTINSINVYRDVGGSASVLPGTLQEYEQDTGFVRFGLGTYIPPGSTVSVNYSGSYTSTPGDLKLAIQIEAVIQAILLTMPEGSHAFDIDALKHKQALLLTEYVRNDD